MLKSRFIHRLMRSFLDVTLNWVRNSDDVKRTNFWRSKTAFDLNSARKLGNLCWGANQHDSIKLKCIQLLILCRFKNLWTHKDTITLAGKIWTVAQCTQTHTQRVTHTDIVIVIYFSNPPFFENQYLKRWIRPIWRWGTRW